SKIETTDAVGLEGSKSFEQVVVPQTTELKELPSLAFSFFDPEKKTYTTLGQPAMPLVIRPTSPPQGPAVLAAQPQGPGAPLPPTDIVHIKTRPGPLVAVSGPWVMHPWFVALQGVPVLA